MKIATPIKEPSIIFAMMPMPLMINNKISSPPWGYDDSYFIVHAGTKMLKYLEKPPALVLRAFFDFLPVIMLI
ncbi:hypothetical protein DXC69_01415 [Paenibacillus polymyxa]|nr:hypothetical protein C1T20_01495 [Paenibacillus polymyxa]PTU47795.1 hypothetical protein DBL67_06265 [Paenibacillus polymyxa]RGL39666.1 hypothetical protein DXC69_01415 [Paenibacillus polymyxa]RPD97482.1 hypothetical protein EG487_26170 [Paenibacillus polymyxa]